MTHKIIITDEQLRQIESMAGIGLNEEQICHVLGIGYETLKRRKKEYTELVSSIQKGKSKAQTTIGKRLYDKALDGDISAIIWWEKTRADRREKSEHKTELVGTLALTFEQEIKKAEAYFKRIEDEENGKR